jgi:hypothetical protein
MSAKIDGESAEENVGKMSGYDSDDGMPGCFGGPRLISGMVYLVRGNGHEYVGSTKCRRLEDRLARHRRDFELHRMQIRKPTTTCHVCFEGLEEPTIECLETVEFPENDNTLLLQAETRHKEARPGCVNRATPYVSQEDKAQKKRDYDRQYDKERRGKGRLESKECGCGGRYSDSNRQVHFRSKRHMAWVDG